LERNSKARLSAVTAARAAIAAAVAAAWSLAALHREARLCERTSRRLLSWQRPWLE
jgi:hypothetical protein